jgi:hypothetical protein
MAMHAALCGDGKSHHDCKTIAASPVRALPRAQSDEMGTVRRKIAREVQTVRRLIRFNLSGSDARQIGERNLEDYSRRDS